MRDWIEICAIEDVPRLEGRRVVVRGFHIAVFNTDAGFYAVGDVCPHEGGPLHDGLVENCVVACPLHARTIDLRTGEVTNDDLSRIPTFPARVEDGRVYLDVSGLPEVELGREEGAA